MKQLGKCLSESLLAISCFVIFQSQRTHPKTPGLHILAHLGAGGDMQLFLCIWHNPNFPWTWREHQENGAGEDSHLSCSIHWGWGIQERFLAMQSTHQTSGQRICFKTIPAQSRGREGWVRADCSEQENELSRVLGIIQYFTCLPTPQIHVWPGLLHCIITTKASKILIWQKIVLDLWPISSFSGVGRCSRNGTSLGFRKIHVPCAVLEECFW